MKMITEVVLAAISVHGDKRRRVFLAVQPVGGIDMAAMAMQAGPDDRGQRGEEQEGLHSAGDQK